MNIKKLLNNAIFFVTIPCLISNHIFTIIKVDNKNNDKFFNQLDNNNILNNDNDKSQTPNNKTIETITTDNSGQIISKTKTTTPTSTSLSININNSNHNNNSNNNVISKLINNESLPFRLLFINKFQKKFKHNDIVALIDPKSPNETIVRRIVITSDEMPPFYNSLPDGSFMYAEPNENNENIFKVTPIGMIQGKVMFYV